MPSVIFFALPLTFTILVLVRGKEKKQKRQQNTGVLCWCITRQRIQRSIIIFNVELIKNGIY